ncbi:MAG: vWA domain-containing protein [Methylococcaceae bacterium]
MKNNKLFCQTAIAAVLSGLAFSQTAISASTADIIFVVDESGSMSGEHAWLQGMVTTLDSELNGAGVSNNRYGIVGFGGSSTHLEGHGHDAGGNPFGTASQASTAVNTLVTSGGTEDGYDGINAAFNYNLRSDAATNIILVTDEDRDVVNAALNFSGIQSAFGSNNALLNVVVDAGFSDASSGDALGVDASRNAYLADGAGGFTSTAGGVVGNGDGTTIEDYVDLAFATGGASWDLNLLRAGGLTADSFTRAFIDIKVAEITQQVPVTPTNPQEPTSPIDDSPAPANPAAVPVPAALPLMGFGLAGLGWFGRNRKTT